MGVVAVERHFEEPVEFDTIQEQEDRAAWCLSAHRVRFLRTYFSTDRKRMICLYEAPDAEAVRDSQRQAGLPFERVWAATVHDSSPAESERTASGGEGAEVIVVERPLDAPITMDRIQEMMRNASWCLAAHRVRHRRSCLSADGKHVVCIFEAVDAEAVRDSQRQAGLPFARAFPATVHEPSAGE